MSGLCEEVDDASEDDVKEFVQRAVVLLREEYTKELKLEGKEKKDEEMATQGKSKRQLKEEHDAAYLEAQAAKRRKKEEMEKERERLLIEQSGGSSGSDNEAAD